MVQSIDARFRQETANIINRLAQEDPTWGRFLSRSPSYRYFHIRGGKDEYFWTTEPINHLGHKRFASGVYRFIKSRDELKLVNERYHARRKDAKARALQLRNAEGREA